MSDLAFKQSGMGAKPALIVVDMINAFTDPQCELGSESTSVVAANLELLTLFRERALPVYFTTVAYDNEQQASVFRERVPALNVLQVGSDWVEVDARLNKAPDEPLIKKHWASAFFKTDLADQLKQQGVDTIVVTGLTTSGCVRATAVDGLQHDLKTVVASDAVGDRNAAAHEANLHDLNAKYADVLSNQDIKTHLA